MDRINIDLGRLRHSTGHCRIICHNKVQTGIFYKTKIVKSNVVCAQSSRGQRTPPTIPGPELSLQHRGGGLNVLHEISLRGSWSIFVLFYIYFQVTYLFILVLFQLPVIFKKFHSFRYGERHCKNSVHRWLYWSACHSCRRCEC